jgi:hypothetical protein
MNHNRQQKCVLASVATIQLARYSKAPTASSLPWPWPQQLCLHCAAGQVSSQLLRTPHRPCFVYQRIKRQIQLDLKAAGKQQQQM